MRLAVEAFEHSDADLAVRSCELEDQFDHSYIAARQAHVERRERRVCQPKAEVLFVDALRDLERISDHADNIGVSVSRTVDEEARRHHLFGHLAAPAGGILAAALTEVGTRRTPVPDTGDPGLDGPGRSCDEGRLAPGDGGPGCATDGAGPSGLASQD